MIQLQAQDGLERRFEDKSHDPLQIPQGPPVLRGPFVPLRAGVQHARNRRQRRFRLDRDRQFIRAGNGRLETLAPVWQLVQCRDDVKVLTFDQTNSEDIRHDPPDDKASVPPCAREQHHRNNLDQHCGGLACDLPRIRTGGGNTRHRKY